MQLFSACRRGNDKGIEIGASREGDPRRADMSEVRDRPQDQT
jgi:hypothetical protein